MNPTLAQKDISDLQLTVKASHRDKVIMIEAGANEGSRRIR